MFSSLWQSPPSHPTPPLYKSFHHCRSFCALLSFSFDALFSFLFLVSLSPPANLSLISNAFHALSSRSFADCCTTLLSRTHIPELSRLRALSLPVTEHGGTWKNPGPGGGGSQRMIKTTFEGWKQKESFGRAAGEDVCRERRIRLPPSLGEKRFFIKTI